MYQNAIWSSTYANVLSFTYFGIFDTENKKNKNQMCDVRVELINYKLQIECKGGT